MAKSKDKTTDDKDSPAPAGPRMDAYVLMLFITLLALAGGTTLMYLDYDEYGSKVPPDPFREKGATPPKLGEGIRPEGKIDPSALPPRPKEPMDPMGGTDPMGGMPMPP